MTFAILKLYSKVKFSCVLCVAHHAESVYAPVVPLAELTEVVVPSLVPRPQRLEHAVLAPVLPLRVVGLPRPPVRVLSHCVTLGPLELS